MVDTNLGTVFVEAQVILGGLRRGLAEAIGLAQQAARRIGGLLGSAIGGALGIAGAIGVAAVARQIQRNDQVRRSAERLGQAFDQLLTAISNLFGGGERLAALFDFLADKIARTAQGIEALSNSFDDLRTLLRSGFETLITGVTQDILRLIVQIGERILLPLGLIEFEDLDVFRLAIQATNKEFVRAMVDMRQARERLRETFGEGFARDPVFGQRLRGIVTSVQSATGAFRVGQTQTVATEVRRTREEVERTRRDMLNLLPLRIGNQLPDFGGFFQ